MEITWINLNYKDKKFGKNAPLCRIGNTKEDSEFYRCDRVKGFMKDFTVGTLIDESSFKVENVKEGNLEAKYIVHIKALNPTASSYTNKKEESSASFNLDLSRKQTCANVAGQLMRSMQGFIEPENAVTKFKEFYEAVNSILI